MSQILPFDTIFYNQDDRRTVETRVSLPAVLSNLLVLVDYVAIGSAVPTPWAWDVWERFTAEERNLRARLSPLLIHGLALQERWLRTIPAGHAADREWDALREIMVHLPDADVRQLVAEGWISSTHYYLTHLVRTAEMDRLLPENAGEITAAELADNPELLNRLNEFTFRSWGVDVADIPGYMAFAADIDQVRRGIVTLLDAVWRYGAEQQWNSGQSRLQTWTESADVDRPGGDPLSVVRELTGRTPSDAMQPVLAAANRMAFLPVLQLGSNQRALTIDSTTYVMFEPLTGVSSRGARATDPMTLADAVALVRALSDPAAFSLVQALADSQERYALEIAEQSGIHQSTVSRQLAALERHGIVRVRREGKAKYYQLQRDQVRAALNRIDEVLDT